MQKNKITGTPFSWVKKLTIGGISGVVGTAIAIIGFRYDNIQIQVSFPDSKLENNTERNIVVFTDSRQTNLADLPLMPEFTNSTNGTINDLNIRYSIAPIAGTSIGLSISPDVMFSVNGNSRKMDFKYTPDKLTAFSEIGSPFHTMLQQNNHTANAIEIFCSHKGIKEPFKHRINLYTYNSAVSNHLEWERWCQKTIEKKHPDDSIEICYVFDGKYKHTRQGNVKTGSIIYIQDEAFSTSKAKQTEERLTPRQPEQTTRKAEVQPAEQSEKQSAVQPATEPSAQTTAQPASQQPVSQQPARKPAAPIDVKYTFNNPDISFSVTKCAYAGGTVYVDLIITNNSGASLSNAYLLQQEPCAGYESWNCKAYDDQGNAYNISRVKASGNDRGIGSNYPLDLPDGVPVKARLYISGVSSNAESFSLLKLAFRGMDTAEPYGAALLQLKNIPFTK